MAPGDVARLETAIDRMSTRVTKRLDGLGERVKGVEVKIEERQGRRGNHADRLKGLESSSSDTRAKLAQYGVWVGLIAVAVIAILKDAIL